MSIPVVCVSSRNPTEWYYRLDTFLLSAKRLGFTPVVLGMDEKWQGLMTKPNLFRKWLRESNSAPNKRAILTDCWDVVFAQHPDSISARCEALFGDAVVFNTERACWPHPELAVHFPDEGTPWRYLNGGVMCGTIGNLLGMFEGMDLESIGFDRKNDDGTWHNPNDATPLVNAFVNQKVPVKVDARCQVFQSFSGSSLDEFEITSTGVRNKLTDTWPGILHFNGDAKNEIMPKVMAEMNL